MEKYTLPELQRLTVSQFKESSKSRITVVLDNIRSRHNVGAIFRICDAFLLQELILCGITPTPPHREIEKTAIGATESVNWSYQSEIQKVLEEKKALQNTTLVAVEQIKKSTSLEKFKPQTQQHYVFIFGNEVMGIQDAILPYCDLSLEIPQRGTKHSLNVSVSMGIVLWDCFSKMYL